MKYPIVIVAFPFLENPYVTKTRPAICLQALETRPEIVTLVYITSQKEASNEKNVCLKKSDPNFPRTGLIQESTVNLEKIFTVSVSEIKGVAGVLEGDFVTEFQQKLKQHLQLP